MFAGFTGTFLKNGGQPLLYQHTKKGARNNPDNYGGISLLNTGYKTYSKIIAEINTVLFQLTFKYEN